jgi:hypothetical protein
MSEDKPKVPKREPRSDREARLARALRDNLRRRKTGAVPPAKPVSDG